VSAAIRSELLKLRTTRTFFGIVGAALLIVGLIAAAAAAAGDFGRGDRPGVDLLDVGTVAPYFALILGVLAVSTEFRHGTITPTLLAIPSRGRLVGAKLLAHLGAGALFGLAAYGLAAALALPILSARGVDTGLTADQAFEMIAGGTAATALATAFGVGVGAVVRNQVGAVIAVLVYLFMGEPLLMLIPSVGPAIEDYGLHSVLASLAASPGESSDELSQVTGGLLLAGYVAVLIAAGVALLRNRDVTA
jgi:ABC-2 type transport system permease protein